MPLPWPCADTRKQGGVKSAARTHAHERRWRWRTWQGRREDGGGRRRRAFVRTLRRHPGRAGPRRCTGVEGHRSSKLQCWCGPPREGVDPGVSGLHRAAGCGSGAVVAGTSAPHPPLHPSIHHPWVGGWKARVSMGGWTSSADEGGRPAAGERRSAVGMGRRGRRRGEQAAAGLERRSLRASFGLVGWGLGFQFFILVYFLI